jgi:hypothetical protein
MYGATKESEIKVIPQSWKITVSESGREMKMFNPYPS